jgi:hypothetical protein
VNLPGVKVLTCRTAVYESLRPTGDRYKAREYEHLGLRPEQQRAFLTEVLNGRVDDAEARYHAIQHNIQVRLLAGNLFMLSLIAQVPVQKISTATRAAFYEAAVGEMWSRKLANHPDAHFRTGQRDCVLTALAHRMGMEHIEVPLSWLEQTARQVDASTYQALIGYLNQAGLVHLQQRGEQVSFGHLTFQEFYLARMLQQGTLQTVLERYWKDARYEETLGLLLSLFWQRRPTRRDRSGHPVAGAVGGGHPSRRPPRAVANAA